MSKAPGALFSHVLPDQRRSERIATPGAVPFQNVPSAADGGMIVNAEVRVVQIYGEPWFVAKDVTSILGFKNGPAAIAEHVLPDQRADIAIHDGRQNRIQSIISESGLYRLIMRSNVPDQAQRN